MSKLKSFREALNKSLLSPVFAKEYVEDACKAGELDNAIRDLMDAASAEMRERCAATCEAEQKMELKAASRAIQAGAEVAERLEGSIRALPLAKGSE